MPLNIQTPKKGECVSRTFESMMLTGTQESSQRGLFFGNRNKKEATTIKDARGKRAESAILTGTKDSSEDGSFAHQKEAKPIIIDGGYFIYSVAFLDDGKHVVSGGWERKVRRWRAEYGREVGMPMDVGSDVYSIAVSPDEKWIVSGADNGQVAVWNAENHSKVTEWKAHNDVVYAVDVSLDGTRIMTGSEDQTLRLVTLHWRVSARPLQTQRVGGRGQAFTKCTTETSRPCYAVVWMPNRATKYLHCSSVVIAE